VQSAPVDGVHVGDGVGDAVGDAVALVSEGDGVAVTDGDGVAVPAGGSDWQAGTPLVDGCGEDDSVGAGVVLDPGAGSGDDGAADDGVGTTDDCTGAAIGSVVGSGAGGRRGAPELRTGAGVTAPAGTGATATPPA
jgi:hypothetical protein